MPASSNEPHRHRWATSSAATSARYWSPRSATKFGWVTTVNPRLAERRRSARGGSPRRARCGRRGRTPTSSNAARAMTSSPRVTQCTATGRPRRRAVRKPPASSSGAGRRASSSRNLTGPRPSSSPAPVGRPGPPGHDDVERQRPVAPSGRQQLDLRRILGRGEVRHGRHAVAGELPTDCRQVGHGESRPARPGSAGHRRAGTAARSADRARPVRSRRRPGRRSPRRRSRRC